MTRINCIPPAELTNKHLLAEYRELPRLRHLYPRKITNIPNSYRLGKGHVLFFLDKGQYLKQRYSQLVQEMTNRGYTVNYPQLDLSHWPQQAMNGWTPSQHAITINKQRIKERLSA